MHWDNKFLQKNQVRNIPQSVSVQSSYRTSLRDFLSAQTDRKQETGGKYKGYFIIRSDFYQMKKEKKKILQQKFKSTLFKLIEAGKPGKIFNRKIFHKNNSLFIYTFLCVENRSKTSRIELKIWLSTNYDTQNTNLASFRPYKF